MAIDRKTFIVVNPNSANASTRKQWPEMENTIRESIGPFDWKFTESQGDATPLTREAISNGYDQIVAVGGDGTNNEVINGFFEGEKQINPECAFSFICRGTGGDFRKTFGWSTYLPEAIDRIKSSEQRAIDLGHFSYLDHQGQEAWKYFINITSFGIGGLVDHLCNTSSKILGGKISFMLATARALLAYQNQGVRLKVDDSFEEELVINNVAVANGRYFGGGMMVAPEAEPDDGLFDVIILGDLSKLEVVAQSSSIYRGEHLTQDKVQHLRGKKVYAEPLDPENRVLIDMDGEQPGSLPCVFSVLPKVLPLKV